MTNTQIYSATYSNVPVFEFVTSEGPIMRRKSDSWINATHILKIAKFPKARRTRILEKDVQTGVHEKVQGGYGKYQGTYVPLDVGREIAKNFGVFDVLRPIFEFKYIEGKTETPPPAPKHNHASALNIAKRQTPQTRKSKYSIAPPGEPPKKRGRPKRVPTLKHADTTPIEPGPNIGSFKGSFTNPTLSRQDTEQDALQVMAGNMNIKNEDLELVESDEDDDVMKKRVNGLTHDELHISSAGDDLLGSKELFGASRGSFERVVTAHSNHNSNGHLPSHDPYSLSQYHQPSLNSQSESESIYSEYFSSLLTYFLDDSKIRNNAVPERILNPPQPISKININQAIDNDGNTIFHWACSMANISIIEFLLGTFQISPDIRNNQGETPLMFLVKFINSFQLKNFPSILQLLLESILLVDTSGKTVLHHIASIENDKKNKERFARYYMETLFDKIIESSDDGEDDSKEPDNKKDLIAKFINHQDSDGNTAFHIAAHNLNKRCIKVFISYHRYIDFALRNLVGYTVEDYLASHNYVLRLDDEANEDLEHDESEGLLIPQDSTSTQSFESQLYNSKVAVNLQNTTSNLITEKLTELAYTIDKELSEKDETILTFFKILKSISVDKLASQKAILSIFKLEYLIEDLEKVIEDSNSQELTIDFKRDQIIQEEIYRLVNDLTYQYLHRKDELDQIFKKYKTFELAAELTVEIIKKKQLLKKLYDQQLEVPTQQASYDKENKVEISSQGSTASTASTTIIKPSIVSSYPQDDKLNKYCKLIALCCGMDFNDVESSIDQIEQSLLKSGR
ncbi:transcription factor [Scheffersomyces xylosifermentans]|uniref:transcription factor n=1 Tax=Scheffersomyces xylosifermentans TaxID=1304137 RepID=UPI00315C5C88